MVSLNDVVEIVSSQLKNISERKHPDCDTRCGCNTVDCECKGAHSKKVLETISYPEFIRVREMRLAELQAQIKELEKKES